MKDNTEIVQALIRCMSYLADLNGCEWIKGDDVGSVDMKQRAFALQKMAFSALEKYSSTTGETP